MAVLGHRAHPLRKALRLDDVAAALIDTDPIEFDPGGVGPFSDEKMVFSAATFAFINETRLPAPLVQAGSVMDPSVAFQPSLKAPAVAATASKLLPTFTVGGVAKPGSGRSTDDRAQVIAPIRQ